MTPLKEIMSEIEKDLNYLAAEDFITYTQYDFCVQRIEERYGADLKLLRKLVIFWKTGGAPQ